MRNDALARELVEHFLVGPQDGSGRDGIHAYLGRELACQRSREPDQACLRHRIHDVTLQRPLGDITPTDWDDLIGTNVRAPLFLSQAAAPALRKTQGSIVNITDIHAERPLKSYVVYSVAKAGLVGLTRSLARELAPDIRVNAVAPGPILWPDEEVFDELARQRIISHTPLKREGTPDDIAKAVHYLLADAPYVTGETINVDGGRHIAL